MERYDEYKDSQTTWMGQVPNHWKLERAKWHFTLRNERGNNTPVLLAATQKYGMYPQDMIEGVVKVAEGTDFQQFRTVHKNEFVISLRSFQGGFERSDYEGVCSPAYQVFYADTQLNKNYLKYLFKNELFVDAMNALTVGIREGRNIKFEDFANSIIAIPPMAEQEAIAEYLNRKITHIDSVIEEAKSSIEEYKAWKSSIIYEAVTKGLDPNVEMKDSGVEWIGKIPIGWEVIRLKYFISGYKAGPFGSSLITDRLNPSGNVLVYTPEHIAKKSVDLDKNLYLPDERIEEMQQFIVETGDIIFPIVGSLGRSMLITEEMPTGIINQRLAKFKLDTERLLMDYFLWLFSKSSFYGTYIDLYCRGSIIVNLTKQIVGNMPIPLPANKEEQARICEYLESKCSKVDFMIAEKEALIQDLESYKKSLIFEVVTGKRKVV